MTNYLENFDRKHDEDDLTHIVFFSGGLGSWAGAKRVASRRGTEKLILLFTDTSMEDPDLYRFLEEAARNVGGQLIKLCDGRTPWEVFHDEKFLGNSRIDPCSKILKRELTTKWLEANYTPGNCKLYLGIDWSEKHRYEKIREMRAPWHVRSHLCSKPYLTKNDIKEWLQAEGLKLPRLYELGFDHNNCGGFCVKAGQAHFARLLRKLPDLYDYHANKEIELQNYLGTDNTILRKQHKGDTYFITLKEFRCMVEAGYEYDKFDFGGCGCFSGTIEA